MITVGIGGASRSGKDTVAAFAIQYVGGRTIAFADAMKKLIGPVFEWNAEVLYGPSERRNQVDYRFGSTDARVKVWRRFDEVVESWLKQHLPTGISHDAASLKLHGWLSNVLHASEITPRRVLQMLGDAGRSLRPSFWIDVTFDELRRWSANQALYDNGAQFAFITDVRFINEAAAVKQYGAQLWKVARKNLDRGAVAKAGIVGHRSEVEMDTAFFNSHVDAFLKNDGTLDELKLKVHHLVDRLKETT